MHQPDISNAAQQAQERASAVDIKRFALELDQARPRVGLDGWAEIDGEESVWPKQEAIKVTGPAAASVDRNSSDHPIQLSVPEELGAESRLSHLKRLLGFHIHL